jgi:hypothetical protein
MTIRSWLLGSAMLSAFGCAGCQPAGLHPVSGRILYKGQPAAGATVYFHRNAGAGPSGDLIPSATVADDGRFWIVSGDSYGAPAGTYDVRIEWLDQPTSKRGGAMVKTSAVEKKSTQKPAARSWKPGPSRVRPPDRLKGRYFDMEHPLLTAEVRPGSNDLPPFELAD